jgi:hypothetical protein
VLTDEEKALGFELLFDGQRASGLRGILHSDFLSKGWTIEDGALCLRKTINEMDRVTGGTIATQETYTDFEFRFEFRPEASSNSGVRYCVKEQFGSQLEGPEFQIIDDTHNSVSLKGGAIRRTGALDGVIPRMEEIALVVDKRRSEMGWNEGRIILYGTRVEHWLNGKLVVSYDLGSPTLRAAVRAAVVRQGTAFGGKYKSRIYLQDEGSEISFRSLRIRDLAKAARDAAAQTTGSQQVTAPAPIGSGSGLSPQPLK